MKGYKHTPEARAKISIAAKRRQAYVRTPEIRAKASMVAIKRWKNPEARKKMSEISTKVNARPGMREKQSELRRKYYEIPGMREKQSLTMKNSPAYQISKTSPEYLEKISGPNHWQWRGGCSRGYQAYGTGWTKKLREQIRNRDSYLCQMPGCHLSENGHHHDVHHVDYSKKNFNLTNLITLCHSCHTKTTGGARAHWTEYFQSMQAIRGII